MVVRLYDSVVELATTSRAMGLDLSWRLMVMAKKRKIRRISMLLCPSSLPHHHSRHFARLLYAWVCHREAFDVPPMQCVWFLVAQQYHYLSDWPSRKFRHHPPRNTNATLKGSTIDENPRNFRSMFHPIYQPSGDDKQFEVMYSNVTILSPHSQIFNLHRS